MSDDLFTLAFRPEASDTAADLLRRLIGFTVHVMPANGEHFDAELVDVAVRQDDGEYLAIVAPWSDQLGRGDRTQLRHLPIYDVVQFEVL